MRLRYPSPKNPGLILSYACYACRRVPASTLQNKTPADQSRFLKQSQKTKNNLTHCLLSEVEWHLGCTAHYARTLSNKTYTCIQYHHVFFPLYLNLQNESTCVKTHLKSWSWWLWDNWPWSQHLFGVVVSHVVSCVSFHFASSIDDTKKPTTYSGWSMPSLAILLTPTPLNQLSFDTLIEIYNKYESNISQYKIYPHWDFSQTANVHQPGLVLSMSRKLEIVMKDTQGALSHNVCDDYRENPDKDEIPSGASIDQWTELSHTFHSSSGHVLVFLLKNVLQMRALLHKQNTLSFTPPAVGHS